MTDEVQNQGQGNPAPASGGEPQGGNPPATPDYKAEAEQKEKELREKEDQLRKAGFTIQKLKEKMKEAGVELEEGQGLSEEQVSDIVGKVIEEKLGKVSQENQELKTQLGEVLKSISSRQSISSGGGEGGQKPPVVEKSARPELTPEEEEAVKGLDWDGEKKGWIDPQTKKFFPHERKTTSPKE